MINKDYNYNNPELLNKCYCINESLQLYSFQLKISTSCYYDYIPKNDIFLVFMQYAVLPYYRLTGETNKQLFYQYNLLSHIFHKHFITLGEWREQQINEILD